VEESIELPVEESVVVDEPDVEDESEVHVR